MDFYLPFLACSPPHLPWSPAISVRSEREGVLQTTFILQRRQSERAVVSNSGRRSGERAHAGGERKALHCTERIDGSRLFSGIGALRRRAGRVTRRSSCLAPQPLECRLNAGAGFGVTLPHAQPIPARRFGPSYPSLGHCKIHFLQCTANYQGDNDHTSGAATMGTVNAPCRPPPPKRAPF